jgi:hypothetical protein
VPTVSRGFQRPTIRRLISDPGSSVSIRLGTEGKPSKPAAVHEARTFSLDFADTLYAYQLHLSRFLVFSRHRQFLCLGFFILWVA